MQTESIVSDSAGLRVQWETKNEAAEGTGTFRMTINSAISGRPITTAVDRRGVGRDTAYVSDGGSCVRLGIAAGCVLRGGPCYRVFTSMLAA